MSTAISNLREPLRVLLGDRDASFYLYENTALDAATRTVVAMGKVSGYTLASGNTVITPDFASANDYALLLYHIVLVMIASQPDGEIFRTRAISGGVSGYRNFLHHLEQNIYDLENGTMFRSWQNFSAWSLGLVGVDLWGLLTDVETDRPVATLTVGYNGIQLT